MTVPGKPVDRRAKVISTDQTTANIASILEVLSTSVERLERLSRGMSEQRLRRPLATGERTFAQVLAHLINCEARSSEAIYLALLADEPPLSDIHPERQLGKLLRLEHQPFQDLLSYFGFRRRVLLGVLRQLNEKSWSRAVREDNKQRKESVYWRARTLAMHELDHLADLERKILIAE